MARGRPDWRAGMAGIGVAWVVIVGFLVLLNNPVVLPPAGQSPSATRVITATGAVAAATDAGGTPVAETFDDLSIDSPLPEPWATSGSGTAAVIPLPTSVDRSVRLRSSQAGGGLKACRPIVAGAPDVHVAVDVLVGTLPEQAVGLLSLEAGGQPAFELTLGPDGSIEPNQPVTGVVVQGVGAPPAATPSGGAADSTWRHLVIDGPMQADAVCLRSPDGVASGWIAIDNVAVGR